MYRYKAAALHVHFILFIYFNSCLGGGGGGGEGVV